MEKQLNKFISAIFHPMLFPTYYLLVVLNMRLGFLLMIPEKGKWMITGLIFITTYLLPMLISKIIFSSFSRFFSTNGHDKQSLLLATAIFFYVTTYYLFTGLQISPMITIFILGSTSLLVLTIVISAFWNISAYMIATGALFGAYLSMAIILKIDLLLLLISLILLSGYVGYSRLKTSNHQPLQVYSGFFLGTVIMYLHFLYF